MHSFQIAIDGPVAAGKGTISKQVAERLGFLYVDTGATYRVATILAVRNNFDFDKLDQEDQDEVFALSKLVEKSNIEMYRPREGERDGRLITVIVNSEDVSWPIRDEAISRKVSIVAKLAKIREVLVSKQQQIAIGQNVVMEGRDITYRVLPDAQLKIYLDAKPEERAKRRTQQLLLQGQVAEYETVLRDVLRRDEIDSNRTTDPLKRINEAWYLDTSDLDIDQVVEMIVSKAQQLMS